MILDSVSALRYAVKIACPKRFSDKQNNYLSSAHTSTALSGLRHSQSSGDLQAPIPRRCQGREW
jgi:hypothetical protein